MPSDDSSPDLSQPPGEATTYDRATLEAAFDDLAPWLERELEKTRGNEEARRVLDEAKKELIEIEVPCVGDPAIPLPQVLIQSAVGLAVTRALAGSGDSSLADAGSIIYEACAAQLRSTPAAEAKQAGEMQFGEQWYQLQRFVSQKSQERHYPYDWVFGFVEGGQGDDFDWGWDFTECGICKLLGDNDASELVPYFCALDFVDSEISGTGLARTKTLAEGADACDFRFKKGRKVEAPRVPGR